MPEHPGEVRYYVGVEAVSYHGDPPDYHEPEWLALLFRVDGRWHLLKTAKYSWYSVVQGNMSCDCNRAKVLGLGKPTGQYMCGDLIELLAVFDSALRPLPITYD